MTKVNKIAILGAGNLGISIATGIVEKKLKSASDIFLTRRHTGLLDKYRDLGYEISSDNRKAVEQSEIIFLCVQPKQIDVLIEVIKPVLRKDHILVSVITGVSLDLLREKISGLGHLVRAMPNTAVAIGQSMTCLATQGADTALKKVEPLFQTLGLTLLIEERLMQAATVLGASGIAFFMRYLRAATQAGVQMGFDTEEAQKIAVQTAKGAASLILAHNSHPEVEIDKVTTPQGCTIEGLNEMEHQGFSSSLIKGVMTSFNKINQMKS
ncbi:pyrroline-5-carboxylate reductase [Cyclobacteriaceae bacterium]|jgi:pyrroline-5-carboxylate reductase|nr:pyrroline-5-carboxylate reductase [Cyclobacteriaceae bacterium]MDC1516297.1 pyrroline-5-carboxylate reductase [Cyclobacteriaceae bacterium]|tara:strand:+ start:162 stop:965 length:804 start_codon:yes stop_codon:yes gene_type:complete